MLIKHAKNYGYLKIPKAQMGNHKLMMLRNREKINERKIKFLDNQIDSIRDEISAYFAENHNEENNEFRNNEFYIKMKENKLDQLLAKKNLIKTNIRNERSQNIKNLDINHSHDHEYFDYLFQQDEFVKQKQSINTARTKINQSHDKRRVTLKQSVFLKKNTKFDGPFNDGLIELPN